MFLFPQLLRTGGGYAWALKPALIVPSAVVACHAPITNANGEGRRSVEPRDYAGVNSLAASIALKTELARLENVVRGTERNQLDAEGATAPASMIIVRVLVLVFPQVSVATKSIVSVATALVSMTMLLTSVPFINVL